MDSAAGADKDTDLAPGCFLPGLAGLADIAKVFLASCLFWLFCILTAFFMPRSHRRDKLFIISDLFVGMRTLGKESGRRFLYVRRGTGTGRLPRSAHKMVSKHRRISIHRVNADRNHAQPPARTLQAGETPRFFTKARSLVGEAGQAAVMAYWRRLACSSMRSTS